MSDVRKALERIKKEVGTPYFSSLYDIDDWKEDWSIVEKVIEKYDEIEEMVRPFWMIGNDLKWYIGNIKRNSDLWCEYSRLNSIQTEIDGVINVWTLDGILKVCKERDEALKRIKELESVAKKYEELKNKYSRCCYVCKDRDLNTCKHLNKPTTLETFIECQELNQVYMAKRIDDLEQKNKVLVDFLNDMEIKFSSYGFFFVANRVTKDKAFEILDIIKPNSDYVKQLKKAMLERVEVE